jgi:Pentapeptide repeats (8 copies)
MANSEFEMPREWKLQPEWKPSTEELREILSEHKKWRESGHREGRQANLSQADLIGSDLRGVMLTDADLWNAFLQGEPCER